MKLITILSVGVCFDYAIPDCVSIFSYYPYKTLNYILPFQNDRSINIMEVKNCDGPKGIIRLSKKELKFSITKECELLFSGCLSVKKFKFGRLLFTVKNGGLAVVSERRNLCHEMGNDYGEFRDLVTAFKFPRSCPTKGGRFCAKNARIDISRYEGFLNIANGVFVFNLKINHDRGTSCIKIKFEMVTKNDEKDEDDDDDKN